ncbi:MAG: type II toxin-antitoxin system RelE/ParE family toxin [Isosphaeraceae bacterium]
MSSVSESENAWKNGRVAEVTLHPEAEAEYEHVLAWYLERSPQAAERFESAFHETIEAISSHPEMFPLCDDIHRYVLLKRYPYSLIYRLDGDVACVIAVAHSKRLPGYWSTRP